MPTLLLLSLRRGIGRRVTILAGEFTVVLALAALYTRSQARPFGEFPRRSLSIAFAITAAIASFKGISVTIVLDRRRRSGRHR